RSSGWDFDLAIANVMMTQHGLSPQYLSRAFHSLSPAAAAPALATAGAVRSSLSLSAFLTLAGLISASGGVFFEITVKRNRVWFAVVYGGFATVVAAFIWWKMVEDGELMKVEGGYVRWFEGSD
ncbi:hypothetical protein A2U01_0013965, partial [Trifolium medium]|nr:hypothetical protein [Trifolium medium]